MHGSGIPIWFFIGVLLAIYGGLVLGYGLYEWSTGLYPAGVQLTQLHTPVWLGRTAVRHRRVLSYQVSSRTQSLVQHAV